MALKLKSNKKGLRSGRNKTKGKYARQFARTEANLARKGKTNKKRRAALK